MGFPSFHRSLERFLLFLPFRILNRRDSTLWSSLVSDDLTSDEISATGGHQRFAQHLADTCIYAAHWQGGMSSRQIFKKIW